MKDDTDSMPAPPADPAPGSGTRKGAVVLVTLIVTSLVLYVVGDRQEGEEVAEPGLSGEQDAQGHWRHRLAPLSGSLRRGVMSSWRSRARRL